MKKITFLVFCCISFIGMSQQLTADQKIQVLQSGQQSVSVIEKVMDANYTLPEIDQANKLKKNGILDVTIMYVLSNRIKLTNEDIVILKGYQDDKYSESIIKKSLDEKSKYSIEEKIEKADSKNQQQEWATLEVVAGINIPSYEYTIGPYSHGSMNIHLNDWLGICLSFSSSNETKKPNGYFVDYGTSSVNTYYSYSGKATQETYSIAPSFTILGNKNSRFTLLVKHGFGLVTIGFPDEKTTTTTQNGLTQTTESNVIKGSNLTTYYMYISATARYKITKKFSVIGVVKEGTSEGTNLALGLLFSL